MKVASRIQDEQMRKSKLNMLLIPSRESHVNSFWENHLVRSCMFYEWVV